MITSPAFRILLYTTFFVIAFIKTPAPGHAQGLLASDQSGIRAAVITLLQEGDALPLVVRQNRAAFEKYYVDQGGQLLWIGTGGMNALIRQLKFAGFEGLDPAHYRISSLEKLKAGVPIVDTPGRAKIELIFSAFFLRYAADIKIGRFLPNKVDPNLYWRRKKVDLSRALTILAQEKKFDQWTSAWQPQIPEYRALKKTLRRYFDIAAKGGWQPLPPGETIKPGMTDLRVHALRARLAVTDNRLSKAAAGDEAVYTPDLVAAVKRFQHRHGLEPDGVVGKGTLFALNISVFDRLRQIVVSMERWRWMPEQLGQHYIMVNIAGFELRRVRSGQLEEKMRVVVGKAYHQTPVFSNAIRYLEINPYWNVPYSIATKEELPKLQSNPASFAARGFEAVIGENPVEVTAIDWNQYSRTHFPLRLRQRPGPRNALGRVKLMFPNKFNVYLHDTPSRSLFARAKRAFSHGCIRLHRPIDLTEQVLRNTSGWDRARIEKVLASKERTIVNLSQPLPVHITYSTAWLDEKGAMQFRADVYRRDVKLHRALFGKTSSW